MLQLVKKRLSSEAAAAANQSGRWRNQMRKAAHDGCCRRVAQSRALGSVLWKLLISENLVEALTRIENPLVCYGHWINVISEHSILLTTSSTKFLCCLKLKNHAKLLARTAG